MFHITIWRGLLPPPLVTARRVFVLARCTDWARARLPTSSLIDLQSRSTNSLAGSCLLSASLQSKNCQARTGRSWLAFPCAGLVAQLLVSFSVILRTDMPLVLREQQMACLVESVPQKTAVRPSRSTRLVVGHGTPSVQRGSQSSSFGCCNRHRGEQGIAAGLLILGRDGHSGHPSDGPVRGCL